MEHEAKIRGMAAWKEQNPAKDESPDFEIDREYPDGVTTRERFGEDGEFKEEDHPRAENGQFGAGCGGSVKEKISNLPKYEGGDAPSKEGDKNYVENPIPSNPIRTSLLYEMTEGRQSTDGEVSLSDITSGQRWVNKKTLGNVADYEGDKETPEIVKLKNGKYAVLDGNHRIAHALMMGQTKIKARIY